MGIWDLINSTTEACKTSYGYCNSAGGKVVNAVRSNSVFTNYIPDQETRSQVVNAVRSNSQRVTNYITDQETRSQMGLFASKFAQNSAKYALQESYKMVPGGQAFAEIVTKTMRDVKSENQSKQGREAMKETIGGGEGKNSTSRNLRGKAELQSGGGVELGYEKPYQSPEDVLRIFMMKEFMGNRFADELLLPQIKYGKKETSKEKLSQMGHFDD